ncbi:MAG: hypothetical protein ABI948_07225 [Thermoleophilia bacterium]
MRSYDFHGVDDLVETEHEQLARICGLPVDVVAAAFAAEPVPVPGLIRTDAELEDVHERIRRGDAAQAELNYRAMVNDCSPVTVYPDDDLDAA